MDVVGQPKIPNVMEIVRLHAKAGNFIILPHAIERRIERHISVGDIVHVLISGKLEPDKDEYKHEFRSWNYAVRGKTIDGRELRVAIALDSNEMLIITVIRLGTRRK